MEKHPIIKGCTTSRDFEKHIRQVEQYLAYEDPETILYHRLEEQVMNKGVISLTKAEQVYYALNVYLDVGFNGLLVEHVNEGNPDLHSVIARSLNMLGFDDLEDEYKKQCNQIDAGVTFSEEQEWAFLDLFSDSYTDLEIAVDQYARDQELLDSADGEI